MKSNFIVDNRKIMPGQFSGPASLFPGEEKVLVHTLTTGGAGQVAAHSSKLGRAL